MAPRRVRYWGRHYLPWCDGRPCAVRLRICYVSPAKVHRGIEKDYTVNDAHDESRTPH